jgi:hypothetical protein
LPAAEEFLRFDGLIDTATARFTSEPTTITARFSPSYGEGEVTRE